jgi:hypothetical protein
MELRGCPLRLHVQLIESSGEIRETGVFPPVSHLQLNRFESSDLLLSVPIRSIALEQLFLDMIIRRRMAMLLLMLLHYCVQLLIGLSSEHSTSQQLQLLCAGALQADAKLLKAIEKILEAFACHSAALETQGSGGLL